MSLRTRREIETGFAETAFLEGGIRYVLGGVGGAGMSGLAILLHQAGKKVVGFDQADSGVLDSLRAMGVDCQTGIDLIQGDRLIMSDALDLSFSSEYAQAQVSSIPVFRRSQGLSWILENKKVVAVTGSHGKSTTTALLRAALAPQVSGLSWFIGAGLPDGASARFSNGEFAVVEACEAYGGLSDFHACGVVVTNIEFEHRDFYDNIDQVFEAFEQLIKSAPTEGFAVLPSGAAYDGIAGVARCRIFRYSGYDWDRLGPGQPLLLPGKHNKENAAAALIACQAIGCNLDGCVERMAEFPGIKRRLEQVFDGQVSRGKLTVYDDYAHHPTEIAASLNALKTKHPNRRIVVAFQPHLYSRTDGAYDEFASALDIADLVVLTEIYPAREEPLPGVSAVRIDERLTTESVYVPAIGSLAIELPKLLRDKDVVVVMGAGDIEKSVAPLLDELHRGSVKKVVIAYGGDSPEREISIHSSLSAYEALKDRYEVTRVDFSKKILESGDLSFLVGANRPDVVLLAVHGSRAEDGAIQGLLELAHIPYTGSGIQSSALCVDKSATKQILELHGIPTAKGWVLDRHTPLPLIDRPVVVKPNSQGSTVGMSFVSQPEDLESAVSKAFEFDDKVLIEDWLQGRELTVPVLGGKALPPIEIKPLSGQYDFANKYTPGKTEKICSADVPSTVQTVALAAHKALKCEGLTRVDIILVGETPYVLEINTLPGMTKTSLVSLSAKAAGIEFVDMLTWMLEDAYGRWQKK